jgi:hypothetical protein
MSTLTEIEAAIEHLPEVQQVELLAFLTQRLKKSVSPATTSPTDDPFGAMIGAFAGVREATGRKAEELLYGKDA